MAEHRMPHLNVRSDFLVYLWNVPLGMRGRLLKEKLNQQIGPVRFIETFEAWNFRQSGHMVVEFNSPSSIEFFAELMEADRIPFLNKPVGFQDLVSFGRRRFFEQIYRDTGVDLLGCDGNDFVIILPPSSAWNRQRSRGMAVRDALDGDGGGGIGTSGNGAVSRRASKPYERNSGGGTTWRRRRQSESPPLLETGGDGGGGGVVDKSPFPHAFSNGTPSHDTNSIGALRRFLWSTEAGRRHVLTIDALEKRVWNSAGVFRVLNTNTTNNNKINGHCAADGAWAVAGGQQLRQQQRPRRRRQQTPKGGTFVAAGTPSWNNSTKQPMRVVMGSSNEDNNEVEEGELLEEGELPEEHHPAQQQRSLEMEEEDWDDFELVEYDGLMCHYSTTSSASGLHMSLTSTPASSSSFQVTTIAHSQQQQVDDEEASTATKSSSPMMMTTNNNDNISATTTIVPNAVTTATTVTTKVGMIVGGEHRARQLEEECEIARLLDNDDEQGEVVSVEPYLLDERILEDNPEHDTAGEGTDNEHMGDDDDNNISEDDRLNLSIRRMSRISLNVEEDEMALDDDEQHQQLVAEYPGLEIVNLSHDYSLDAIREQL